MQTGAIHTTKLLQTPTQDQMVNSTKFNYILFSFLFRIFGDQVLVYCLIQRNYSFSDKSEDPQAELLFKEMVVLAEYIWKCN